MVVVLECNHFSSSTITCLDELNRRDLRNRPFKNPGHNPWYKPSLHVHKVQTLGPDHLLNFLIYNYLKYIAKPEKVLKPQIPQILLDNFQPYYRLGIDNVNHISLQ